ncbi:ParB/RepB/Spo0J family partition protein [Massilia sp. TW-1]|uniref:ParB/RepB/Spo0J family partition protein n=1 Tax=Telluria antibiotica TaxID=2717319 RepID=A0ABX0P5P1_9BURK|nr:ParB/RepB/Spo0J family partition protein [Telluria antibiotica]NIA52551.1 ParB/RepB/Spo0J family partition protein [Telluria antibiotica]
MNTRMNLTGFADLAYEERAAKGQPLPIPVDDILPDPENPRNADDENSPVAIAAQEELDADVAERGIKTPISVRPHPAIRGKYVINYGHRRYKSARNNSLATIPGFVDERFDSYDQFNENALRTGLSTRARALFIKSRLDAGETKGEIAQRMRKKNQNFITEHLALLDAPECVNRAYANGVTSARTLYDLRQAWEEFPAEIESWCQHVSQVTREGIKDALESFRSGHSAVTKGYAGAAAEPSISGFRHDEKLPSPEPSAASTTPQFRHDEKGPRRRPQSETRATTPDTPPPDAGGIVVQYKGKRARVVLGATVPIVVDGADSTLDVPLSELVFRR